MVEFQTEEATQVSGQGSVNQTAPVARRFAHQRNRRGVRRVQVPLLTTPTDMAMSVCPYRGGIAESETGWIATATKRTTSRDSIRLPPPSQSQMFASNGLWV